MAESKSSAGAVVTTSHSAAVEVLARAQRVAEACGLPFVPRRFAPKEAPSLVVESDGAHLVLGDRVVRSHPGMGLVRVRRLRKGEEHDPLIELGEVRPGDTILDATLGYAQDALVLAEGAGDRGRVLGIESSPLLAALTMAGAQHWPAPGATLMGRVEVRCADFRSVLPTIPDGSYDIVYFDPMFRRPRMAAPDFAVLRDLAELDPLLPGDIEHACRIARRWVLVKDGFPGDDLRRLGLPRVRSRRSAEIMFGRLPGGRLRGTDAPP
jgi:SAM-dependent methyltransferase